METRGSDPPKLSCSCHGPSQGRIGTCGRILSSNPLLLPLRPSTSSHPVGVAVIRLTKISEYVLPDYHATLKLIQLGAGSGRIHLCRYQRASTTRLIGPTTPRKVRRIAYNDLVLTSLLIADASPRPQP